MTKPYWLDRITGTVAPAWTLQRQRARMALEILARHYEGAARGRRTAGWKRTGADANAVVGPALSPLRETARDLVRNNPYAESALNTIADHTVGSGIVASCNDKAAMAVWKQWAESTTCDADGRNDFYGLQKLVWRTVVESGEVLARRRTRFTSDNVFLNTQIQILDPDFLDTLRDSLSYDTAASGEIVQGVEFNPIGQRIAYWLFPKHPGARTGSFASSQRVPADGTLHVFKQSRPGQVRGPSWYAPVLLRMRDFDDYEDATLMKQKIAACVAVLTSDPDGSMEPIGDADATKSPEWDQIEPGAVMNLKPGRSVSVLTPPGNTDYDQYSKTQLRAIATGLNVTYEDLTGDYAGMPYSAARMSRLRHWARVDDWRWRTLVPLFCDPVWNWVMQAAVIQGRIKAVPTVRWTPEPPPMIDPVNEGLAYQRRIRTGLVSLQEALRELGYDPEVVLGEISDSNKILDKLGIILDSDPRKTTQAGQLQGSAAATGPVPPEPTPAPEP